MSLIKQQNQTDFMKMFLIAVLGGLLVAASGCKEKRTFKTEDGQMEVTRSGKDVRMEFKGEGGTMTMVGNASGVTIPDTFPKDVPVLKGAVPYMAATQDKAQVLHLDLPRRVAEVFQEYQDKLKAEGWTIETTMNMGDSSMLAATKDGRHCNVLVSQNGSKGCTIQLTVAED